MTKKFEYVQCDVPEGVTLQEYGRTIKADRPQRRCHQWFGVRIKLQAATAWMHW